MLVSILASAFLCHFVAPNFYNELAPGDGAAADAAPRKMRRFSLLTVRSLQPHAPRLQPEAPRLQPRATACNPSSMHPACSPMRPACDPAQPATPPSLRPCPACDPVPPR